MTSQPHPTSSTLVSSMQVLEKIFGESQAIVIYVDQHSNQLLDYQVQSLSEVVALLNLNGFGEPVDFLDR